MKLKSVVVAIDFGTSNSGYAYVFVKDTTATIFVQDTWPGSDTKNMKTLTQIILNEKREFVAFGYEARDFFGNHPDAEPDQYPYFAFYKMHLFDHKNRGQPVRALNCIQTATAPQLITATLKFLKNCAINKINNSSSTKIEEKDIQWVITIPAIWDDSSKQIMRQCADTAGLCSKDDKESLMFAYEPEAGALQCIFEGTSGYHVGNGETFLVIDNGGGTADFIAYQQVEGNKLESISRTFGGDYGSIYVNSNFIKFLHSLFGESEIEMKKDTAQFQSFLDSFESLKRTFNMSSGESHKPINFYPMVVFEKSNEWLTSKINTYNTANGTDIKYFANRGKLMLPYSLFLSFFTPLFNNITKCIKEEIKVNPRLNKLNYIFLIGGFNENIFLQEHIKKELEFTGAKFIISKSPSLSVVQGAARFGLNPNTISKRLQTRSYAVEIEEVIQPGKHLGKKLITRAGVQYCPNVCDVLVESGKMVGYDEEFTRLYAPTTLEQKAVEIRIFSSHMPNMEYTTDPGVQFIGELYAILPHSDGTLEDRRIKLSLKFASTELEVTATHVKTGTTMSANYDFALDEAEALRRNRLHQEKNKPPRIQLCIMMDCTGSMSAWISEAKTKMIELTNALKNSYSGLELHITFIGYRDISDSNRFEIVPFTTDMPSLQAKIGSMVADGGGDTPEDIAGALNQANNLSWKSDMIKLIVHVADAPCHGKQYHDYDDSYPDGDPSGLIPQNLLKSISAKGVDYYFIKINNLTDKMIQIFRGSIDTPQKKIVVQDLGSDVSKLLPSLINFVTNSITRFSEKV